MILNPIAESYKFNKDRKREFVEKGRILNEEFEPISPLFFYEHIFQNQLQRFVYIIENQSFRVANSIDELLSLASSRSDIYVPPVSFFNDRFKTKLMNKLYAFVVDIDSVSPDSLKKIIIRIRKPKSLKPTFIMNSGNGLHLYYVLKDPIDCFDYRKPVLRALIKELQKYWDSKEYKVDKKVTLIQSYRVPGSLNKFGQSTSAYLAGKAMSSKRISDFLGINLWASNKKISQVEKSTKELLTDPQVEYLPNGDFPFYKHCINRVWDEVTVGHRYTALFALAVVGYKCRISPNKIRSDIESCFEEFNRRHGYRDRLQEQEIKKALKGYSQDFIQVSSQQLELWFGFNFPRKSKHNGRKQKDHLEIIRAERKIKKLEKGGKIKLLLDEGKSLKEIADALGTSQSNLTTNYKEFIPTRQKKRLERLSEIENLNKQGLSLKEIADALGTSQSNLTTNYKDYIPTRQKRHQERSQAVILLKEKGLSNKEIAESLGMTIRNLNKTYKKELELSSLNTFSFI